jgi:predicted enzyme related to lactoylglutathione lyase
MKLLEMPDRLIALVLVVFTALMSLGCTTASSATGGPSSMQIHYLEIVTKDVDEVCATYGAAHGVQFGAPDAGLGHARTAALPGGGLVGVRAPLRETEEPVVRPYWLVDDIEAAVAAVEAAGGQIAHPPLEIPGHGTFAIYILGGIEHGLWQR